MVYGAPYVIFCAQDVFVFFIVQSKIERPTMKYVLVIIRVTVVYRCTLCW